MNVINFRVWDNKYKFFYDLKSIFLAPDGGVYSDTPVGLRKLLDVTVQRYSGIKCHDKEVYEGDIIKYQYVYIPKINGVYNSEYIECQPKAISEIGYVCFGLINDIDDFYSDYNLGWGININQRITSLYQKIKDYSTDYQTTENNYHITKDYKIEIIGNICQNPELLKNEN